MHDRSIELAARLGLPRRYHINDLPIVLQNHRSNRDDSLMYQSSGMMRGTMGGVIDIQGRV